MSDEIALFIDFENIRYSLINVLHREPDPQELIGIARRFGTVMVARAYADWTRQPEFFKGSLTAAMIDRVDCPAKVRERFRQNNSPAFYGQQQPAYDRVVVREEQSLAEEEYEGDVRRMVEVEEERTLRVVDERDERQDDENCDPEDERDERQERLDLQPTYANGVQYYQQPQPQPQIITQSTVDLNMLMDIIETVFDRPNINTFVLMSGDRDFTRIAARLKLRLNKRVIVVGIPGTVSRDLISAAEQFVPLGFNNAPMPGGYARGVPQQAMPYATTTGPVEVEEAGFIQFLDYIDRHWSWRTVNGVANFIGDPFNPKNRFRGRLTRDSARDLLRICIDEGILLMMSDPMGGENLRLNRDHPVVLSVLNESGMVR